MIQFAIAVCIVAVAACAYAFACVVVDARDDRRDAVERMLRDRK